MQRRRKILWIAALLLGGCAGAAAQPDPARRTAYVDVRALLPVHPMFATLAQYDREIAALQAVQDVPALTNVAARIGAADASVRAALAIADGKSRDAQVRAVAYQGAQKRSLTALASGNRTTSQREVTGRFFQTYRAQALELQSSAGVDLAAYRRELNQERDSAVLTYRSAIDKRLRRAHAARTQQLAEARSNLGLSVGRSTASAILRLRLQLQNTYVSDRPALQAQLTALYARQAGALAARQRSDSAELARYDDRLRRDGAAQFAGFVAEIDAKSAANERARSSVYRDQLAAPVPVQPALAGGGLDLAAEIDRFTRPSQSADASVTSFADASRGLAARFAALRTADLTAAKNARDEINGLRAQRASLAQRIHDHIVQLATADAQRRGFAAVSEVPSARFGRNDVTAEVRSDLETLGR